MLQAFLAHYLGDVIAGAVVFMVVAPLTLGLLVLVIGGAITVVDRMGG